MQIDIKNLYMAEVGYFQYFQKVGNFKKIEYKKLKNISFFEKQGEDYIDIFSGRVFKQLTTDNAPLQKVGVVEPLKYDVLFMPSCVEQINNNPYFSKQELFDIKKAIKKDIVWGSILAEKMQLEKVLGYTINLDL